MDFRRKIGWVFVKSVRADDRILVNGAFQRVLSVKEAYWAGKTWYSLFLESGEITTPFYGKAMVIKDLHFELPKQADEETVRPIDESIFSE